MRRFIQTLSHSVLESQLQGCDFCSCFGGASHYVAINLLADRLNEILQVVWLHTSTLLLITISSRRKDSALCHNLRGCTSQHVSDIYLQKG